MKFLGSQNDSTVFKFSDLGMAINNNKANLPSDATVSGTNIELPYYLVADGGFRLSKHVMTPFMKVPQIPLSESRFNKRLSSARQLIECSFGILAKKWKILQEAQNFNLETTKTIVMALVSLHNFIITQELEGCIDRSYSDLANSSEEVTLDDLEVAEQDNNDADAIAIRNRLTLFVNS